jgi:Carboxypeptidase regulatory-like domain
MKYRMILLATFVSILLLITVSISPHVSGEHNEGVLQAPGYITGTVTSVSSGTPVPSVWVIISQNGSEKGRSLTGDDGKFYIDNLPDGKYDLVATKGNRQVIVKVTLPDERVRPIRDF